MMKHQREVQRAEDLSQRERVPDHAETEQMCEKQSDRQDTDELADDRAPKAEESVAGRRGE